MTEPYFSCPYCLTKINAEKPSKTIQVLGEPLLQKAHPKSNQAENKQEPTNGTEKPAECHHHPGYLSERSSKEQIPDECMVCKDIVECMLKKMRE
jgi:hypothetical protein